MRVVGSAALGCNYKLINLFRDIGKYLLMYVMYCFPGSTGYEFTPSRGVMNSLHVPAMLEGDRDCKPELSVLFSSTSKLEVTAFLSSFLPSQLLASH